jgi:hypothetical protein
MSSNAKTIPEIDSFTKKEKTNKPDAASDLVLPTEVTSVDSVSAIGLAVAPGDDFLVVVTSTGQLLKVNLALLIANNLSSAAGALGSAAIGSAESAVAAGFSDTTSSAGGGSGEEKIVEYLATCFAGGAITAIVTSHSNL